MWTANDAADLESTLDTSIKSQEHVTFDIYGDDREDLEIVWRWEDIDGKKAYLLDDEDTGFMCGGSELNNDSFSEPCSLKFTILTNMMNNVPDGISLSNISIVIGSATHERKPSSQCDDIEGDTTDDWETDSATAVTAAVAVAFAVVTQFI